MKTLTIDLKSFCLGILATSALLVLFNFKPADTAAPADGFRRFQVVSAKDTRTIIIDTQTGRFLIERPSLGIPGWAPFAFEDIYEQK